MNSDNGFEAGFGIAEKRQVFVVIELRMAEQHVEILSRTAGSRRQVLSCFCRSGLWPGCRFQVSSRRIGRVALLGLDEIQANASLRERQPWRPAEL